MTNFLVAQQELSWEFYHPKKQVWQSFGTSGSIQEKLIESLLELISNPTETECDLSEIHRTYTLEEYLLQKLGKENSKLPLKIPIPSVLIITLLKCTSILSRQRTNWHDSFLGLVDSNRKADLHV